MRNTDIASLLWVSQCDFHGALCQPPVTRPLINDRKAHSYTVETNATAKRDEACCACFEFVEEQMNTGKDFSESEMENMMNLSLYKSLTTYGETATSI